MNVLPVIFETILTVLMSTSVRQVFHLVISGPNATIHLDYFTALVNQVLKWIKMETVLISMNARTPARITAMVLQRALILLAATLANAKAGILAMALFAKMLTSAQKVVMVVILMPSVLTPTAVMNASV